ncbi:DUF4760 domain-containing protein, partial [Vibrio cholerae]|uniref:DUF4760 domain-containing protein n=1 Tax=Vibrio cholerae TaxID=666 RepID=UPI001C8D8BE4
YIGIQVELFITKYKDLAEFIYYLTGPFTLIGVLIAMVQLYFYRQDMKIRVKRESLQLSLATLERKVYEIDAAETEAFECDDYEGLPAFKGEIKGFRRDLIHCSNNWLEKMDENKTPDFSYKMMLCLNHLETLSQYILSGICDESECFKLEGPWFLSYVENLKEFIAYSRSEDNLTCYESTVTLYEIWSLKTNESKLIKQKSSIEQQLKRTKLYKKLKTIGA